MSIANKHDREAWPKTVEGPVGLLLFSLTDRDLQLLRGLLDEGLAELHFSLGSFIRNRFVLWAGNQALIDACAD